MTLHRGEESIAKYGILQYNIDVPPHLRDTHYKGAEKLGRGGYLYPHDYPGHWVEQQYMPDSLLGHVYYEFGDNKYEQGAKKLRRDILGKD